jgi:hypothetical protein
MRVTLRRYKRNKSFITNPNGLLLHHPMASSTSPFCLSWDGDSKDLRPEKGAIRSFCLGQVWRLAEPYSLVCNSPRLVAIAIASVLYDAIS